MSAMPIREPTPSSSGRSVPRTPSAVSDYYPPPRAVVGTEPFWVQAIDTIGTGMHPALIGGGSAAIAVNARNYVNLLRLAQRVAPVAEEMLELAVPMLGGED